MTKIIKRTENLRSIYGREWANWVFEIEREIVSSEEIEEWCNENLTGQWEFRTSLPIFDSLGTGPVYKTKTHTDYCLWVELEEDAILARLRW